jgi:LysM repeat protein
VDAQVCPYLLVRDDIVCRAAGQPVQLSAQHVVAVCRSGRYTACSRFPMGDVAVRGARRRAGLIASTAAMVVLAAGATVALARVGNPFTVEPEATPPLVAVTASATSNPTTAPTPLLPSAAAPALSPAPATPTAARPTPTPLRATATVAATNYTVRPGDSLTAVAAAHGISVARLASANGLPINARLRIGQLLVIPAPAATP